MGARSGLYFSLLLLNLLPALYGSARIYFLNDIPDSWTLSIAAQAAWLSLIYEVLSEGLIVPLYFIFGAVSSSIIALNQRLKTTLLFGFIIYSIVTISFYFFSEEIVSTMKQNEDAIPLTVSYIKMEVLAIPIMLFYEISLAYFVVLNKNIIVFFIAIVRSLATFIFDSIYVGNFDFSMNAGVMGVAYTNISVSIVLLFVCAYLMSRNGVWERPISFEAPSWKKQWLLISLRSGLESAIRNLAFTYMVLRLVNEVQQADIFWQTNHFIWAWLLLPILTLGTVVRQDAATNQGWLGKRMWQYLMIVSIIAFLWIALIPTWPWFVKNVMGVQRFSEVVDLSVLMIGFYVVFGFKIIIENYLYGMGRTDLMLRQTIIVNSIYFGLFFVLYGYDLFIPSLSGIALMFGGALIFGACVNFIQFWMAGYFKKTLFPDNLVSLSSTKNQ